MYPLPLEAIACLEVWPLGHDGPVLLSVVTQALLCNFLCVGSSLLSGDADDGCQWKSRLLSAGFCTVAHRRHRVIEGGFTSRVRWMTLIVEWNASWNMFYLLKNLLLLILLIFKLKCNNLIFNEIMVLNASYMCLHTFLLHRESPGPHPGRRTPHFWGGSVTCNLAHMNIYELRTIWCNARGMQMQRFANSKH
jgi:hypothetical protein